MVETPRTVNVNVNANTNENSNVITNKNANRSRHTCGIVPNHSDVIDFTGFFEKLPQFVVGGVKRYVTAEHTSFPGNIRRLPAINTQVVTLVLDSVEIDGRLHRGHIVEHHESTDLRKAEAYVAVIQLD